MDFKDQQQAFAFNLFSRAMSVSRIALSESQVQQIALAGIHWLRANPDLAKVLLKEEAPEVEWAVKARPVSNYKKMPGRDAAIEYAEKLSAKEKVNFGVYWRPKTTQPAWQLDSWIVPPGKDQ